MMVDETRRLANLGLNPHFFRELSNAITQFELSGNVVVWICVNDWGLQHILRLFDGDLLQQIHDKVLRSPQLYEEGLQKGLPQDLIAWDQQQWAFVLGYPVLFRKKIAAPFVLSGYARSNRDGSNFAQ